MRSLVRSLLTGAFFDEILSRSGGLGEDAYSISYRRIEGNEHCCAPTTVLYAYVIQNSLKSSLRMIRPERILIDEKHSVPNERKVAARRQTTAVLRRGRTS
ncbi:hypothetical protein PLICRDRAFT_612706 [Plicaturopsis crispa FD-325 SS-3]|nr:hypothetical protein PLICRDRAFT_612706 [Plicaturopsis crispa FD-325 SS-3]